MNADTLPVAGYYATSRGAVTALLLRERLALLWPAETAHGLSILGYGYAAPYLRLWREARRTVALTPAQLGADRWPRQAPNLSCAAEEDALPFPDLSFDRVLVVHGLETAENARRMLRELWRVLKDDGRLLVVAPNRLGIWAHLETTPFGQGEPFSRGQLDRLLAESLFAVERRETALYLPPVQTRLILRSSRLWEGAGRRLASRFAGVTLTEAVKDVYAGLPTATARRRLVMAEAV